MSLTFVTSYINYNHTPLEPNTHHLRMKKLLHIASTNVPLLVFTTAEHIPFLLPLSNHNQVRIIPVVGTFFEASIIYKMATMVNPLNLPEKRNIPKDTFDYMCFLHSKIEFLRQAVKMNPFFTTHFTWIDSNISHMFPRIETCQDYLQSLSKQYFGQSFLPPTELEEPKIVPTIHQIYLPGCWDKSKSDEDFSNQINWRFCGAFFLAHGNAILHLWKLYELHFMEFLKTTDTMVWDVNFWAWLEACKGWEPNWYKADHNETILRVPIFSHCKILSHFATEQQQYPYPTIEGYFPSSASYLEWEEKGIKHQLVNTRFVNYEYLSSGHCTIHHPDRQVYTKNMCRYDEEGKMMEENPLFMGLQDVGGMFHGLEDIRLFYSKNKIQFLATTVGYSPSGKNRMVLGTYDFTRYQIRDCVLLEPPTDTCREKNWIPFLPRKEEKEFFIYSWTPLFQIGEINSNRLEITRQIPFSHPLIPHEIRGSSNFVWTKEGYIGVVHFSIPDTLPRQYYHLLVCLDLDSYLPISFSDIFCFEKLGIEFCISLNITNDQYIFWFSQQDRDPMEMSVDISHFTFSPIPPIP